MKARGCTFWSVSGSGAVVLWGAGKGCGPSPGGRGGAAVGVDGYSVMVLLNEPVAPVWSVTVNVMV